MDIYTRRDPRKLLIAFFCLCVGIVFFMLSCSDSDGRIPKSFLIFATLVSVAAAAGFMLFFFKKEVALHVDEEGVLTMYLFYLPWKYIDKFYIRETEHEAFIEIKLLDNEKYIAELDPDIYSAFYDEIELGILHEHEMFYFPLTYMELEAESTLEFFKEAQKKYKKK